MMPRMFGQLVLLAALVSPPALALPPAEGRTSNSPPRIVATAQARVSITIISGVRFGPGYVSGAVGADRRKVTLAEADGLVRTAELLEFQ
jgi:hypothetical protein